MFQYDVVLITGQREWNDYQTIRALLKIAQPTIFIDGGAKGADSIGHAIVTERGFRVEYLDWRDPIFPHLSPGRWNLRFCVYDEDWNNPTYGKSAGNRRNEAMLDCAAHYHHEGKRACVLGMLDPFRYGNSRGTANCLHAATRYPLDVFQFPRDLHLWLPPDRVERWYAWAHQGGNPRNAPPPKSHPRTRDGHLHWRT